LILFKKYLGISKIRDIVNKGFFRKSIEKYVDKSVDMLIKDIFKG
jgi:hypothetical protein